MTLHIDGQKSEMSRFKIEHYMGHSGIRDTIEVFPNKMWLAWFICLILLKSPIFTSIISEIEVKMYQM